MAKASAPPGVPTPICRIEVVKAAMSPSLSAKSRRETYFRKELSHLNGPNFLGVNVLLVIRDAFIWDVSRGVLRFRQRTEQLVIVELLRGRVFFFHSSGKSPVAHLIVRMSRPRNASSGQLLRRRQWRPDVPACRQCDQERSLATV